MTTATETRETPRAWVGCLGCYNAGRLVGEWVDATEAEDVTAESLGLVADMYDQHEEFWVFDHEGFGGMLEGECSPMEAQRVATMLEDLPDWIDWQAFEAYAEHVGREYATGSDFEEAYCGQWDSGAAFAEDFCHEVGQISEDSPLASYIDWQRVWRGDFECGDYFEADAPEGMVYVFRSI